MSAPRPLPILFLLTSLLSASIASAQSTPGPGLVATPTVASPQGQVFVTLTALEPFTPYNILLVEDSQSFPLASVGPDSPQTQASFTVTIPELANSGAWQLRLTDRSNNKLAEVPFMVTPSLSIVLPQTARAGTRVPIEIGNLQPGVLSVEYAGRRIVGPVAVETPSYMTEVVLPADIPLAFTPPVAVRADNRIGTLAFQSGSKAFTIQPPISGPTASFSSIQASAASLSPLEPVTLSGQIAFRSDLDPQQPVRLTAFWSDGQGVPVPLGSQTMRIADGPGFNLLLGGGERLGLDARPISGPGLVQVVAQLEPGSSNTDQGLTDQPYMPMATSQSIPLNFVPMTVPQVSIRLQVRSGSTGAAVEAFTEITGIQPAPPRPPSPTPPPDGTGGSGYSLLPHFSTENLIANQPANQISANESLSGISLGQPCGLSLTGRETDANGNVDYLLDLELAPNGLPTSETLVMIARRGPCNEQIPVNCRNHPDRYQLDFQIRVRPKDLRLNDARVRFRYDELRRELFREDASGNWVKLPPEATVNVFVQPRPAPNFHVSAIRLNPVNEVSAAGAMQSGPGRSHFTGVFDWDTAAAFVQMPQTASSRPIGEVLEFSHFRSSEPSLFSAELWIAGERIGAFQRIGGASNAGCLDLQGTDRWQINLPSWAGDRFRTPRRPLPHGWGATGGEVRGEIRMVSLATGTGKWDLMFPIRKLEQTELVSRARAPLTVVNPGRYNGYPEVAGQLRMGQGNSQFSNPGAEYNVGARRNESEDFLVVNRLGLSALNVTGDVARFSQQQQFSRNPAVNPVPLGPLGNAPPPNDPVQACRAISETLLNQNIDLFRWVWGIPEVLSANVRARLRLLAEACSYAYLSNNKPAVIGIADFYVGIGIGADISVLFGVLADAGAYIYGGVGAETITRFDASGASARACANFRMDFEGWLEIGCLFPLDPTCAIPKIRTKRNIINENLGCTQLGNTAVVERSTVPEPEFPALEFDEIARRSMAQYPAIAADPSGTILLLNLELERGLVARNTRDLAAPGTILSTAHGIREIQVSFNGVGDALAVWVESSLDIGGLARATLPEQVAAQRIAWARYQDGVWSTKSFLTNPGLGEGSLAIAGCRDPVRCLRGGEHTLVWQRNESGDYQNPSMRIWQARFGHESGGWFTPERVSTDTGDHRDITPTVTYRNGERVIAWVHYPTNDLSAVETRRLAYRYYRWLQGAGEVQIPPDLPSGIAMPSIAADSTGIAIAFTIAPADAFISAEHHLYLADGDCSNGNCSLTTRPMTDAFGRPVFVERPNLLHIGNGEFVLTARGMGFGGDPLGGNIRPDDPPGMVSNRGDLIRTSLRRGASQVMLEAVTTDAGAHFQPATAFDPVTRRTLVASSVLLLGQTQAVRQAERLAPQGRIASGQRLGNAGAIELFSIEPGSDLRILGLNTNADQLPTSGPIEFLVRIGNAGDGYLSAPGAEARLRAFWNASSSPGGPAADIAIPNLAAGDETELAVNLALPADVIGDEANFVHFEIISDAGLNERRADNNVARHFFSALPVPRITSSYVLPGSPAVQLNWESESDPRVVGYVIEIQLPDGEWARLGSSPVTGFLDVAANQQDLRTYRVRSYSERGAQSDPSRGHTHRVQAEPLTPRLDWLFSDRFSVAP